MPVRAPYPHGLPAIIDRYGRPLDYVEHKEDWERSVLVTKPLRYPLPYAYGDAMITRIRAHRLVVDAFVEVLARCIEAGVPHDRLKYGGCYSWRAVRGGTRLSLHTWGIALDLDPARNPLGKTWDGGLDMMPPKAVELFEEAELTWGGRWDRPDCMHVQAAGGA